MTNLQMSLLSAAVLMLSAPAMAATPISASLGVGTGAIVNSVTTTDDDFEGTGPELTSLEVFSMSTAKLSAVTAFATAYASGAASFESATKGELTLDWGWEWDTTALPSGGVVQLNTNLSVPSFSYAFTADADGLFKANVSVEQFGDFTFGLQGLYSDGDLPFAVYNGPSMLSLNLTAGQTYTVSFFQFGNIGVDTGWANEASATANVMWEIEYGDSPVVPEPATWAMMIAGFGLVGAAARRRRVAAA